MGEAVGFLVEELTDPSPARPALDALAKLNCANIDLDSEAKLAHARFWLVHAAGIVQPSAYALVWLLGTEAEIVDLATAETARRRGAASALLHELEQRYAARGIEALYLEVRATNNPAIALYTKFGFERTRVRRRYYADGEDAWDMRKQLAP